MSSPGSWTKVPVRNRRGRGRPQGLSGKEIGLYYRRLHMDNNNENQSVMINLTIPPAVLSRLQKNIQSIKKTAIECRIDIPPPKSMNVVKIKQENSADTDFVAPSNNIKKEFRDPGRLAKPGTSSDYMSSDEAVSTAKKPIEFKKEPAEVEIKTEPSDVPTTEDVKRVKVEPGTNKPDKSDKKPLSALRGAGDYKYGYEDIITGTFDEKLQECLSKGININIKDADTNILNDSFYKEYESMTNKDSYKKIKKFREILPTYKKSKELLEIINNNQVVVISGETGCGKSTQIPQIILDDAILNKRGGNVHIVVTQPRRIAASSLAIRVAEERAEQLGESIGYAVRLESVPTRPRGSIMFCTTGILLGDLETNQALTNCSHVILDEVHERDCQIDTSMMMLKQVLKKRKDLKLILMSATIDAEALTAYFDGCPMMHIEGLAYPVEDVYLEDILRMTNYTLPQIQDNQNIKVWQRQKMKKRETAMQKDIQFKAEIAPWLESIKREIPREVYLTLQDSRIEDINIDLVFEAVMFICKGPPGAILVFLPGIADITNLLKRIERSNFFWQNRCEVYPLHSKLPSLEQHKIFESPADGARKIIVATNIAETSITIDDIVYVVDSGKIKYSGLNVEDHVHTLKTEWIAQANLRQRRGRAGRCQPGICYHLLTSYRATQLEERLLPEIQRNTLLEPVLMLKRLRLGKALEAMSKMPSPPAEITVQRAVKHLSQIGALDTEERLTPLGWHLARLPVHPAAGKLLLLGTMFGCLDRAASVAAVWGFKDPFQLVIGKEKEVDEAKRNLALGEPSDHVAMSEAILQYERCSPHARKRDFAYDNFLSHTTLDLLCQMKRQFGENLKQMGFLELPDVTTGWENRNQYNISLFKAIVAASLYPNIATVRWRNMNSRNPNRLPRLKARTPENGSITVHPSSVMAAKTYPGSRGAPSVPVCSSPGASWLVYWLKQRSSDLFLIDVTLVYTLPLLFFGELVVTEAEDPEDYCIMISTVKVTCKRTTLELLWQMRCLLDQVIASKIGNASKYSANYSDFENQVLDAVKELITAEDERAEYIGDDDSSSEHSESESRNSGRR